MITFKCVPVYKYHTPREKKKILRKKGKKKTKKKVNKSEPKRGKI